MQVNVVHVKCGTQQSRGLACDCKGAPLVLHPVAPPFFFLLDGLRVRLLTSNLRGQILMEMKSFRFEKKRPG